MVIQLGNQHSSLAKFYSLSSCRF